MKLPWGGRQRIDTRGAEVTPGGSQVHRYPQVQAPSLGVAPGNVEEYARVREEAYKETFGEVETVQHELLPLVPHVDVYVIQRQSDQHGAFSILVTGGMSDMRMTLPQGVGREHARAELILYVRQPQDYHFELLRFLAHFPHDNHSFLGAGHTIPNGQPAEPLFPNSALDTVLLLPPIVRQHDALSETLSLDGDRVNILWAVPITTAECNYKLRFGYGKFLGVLDRVKHPFMLDEQRRSYV